MLAAQIHSKSSYRTKLFGGPPALRGDLGSRDAGGLFVSGIALLLLKKKNGTNAKHGLNLLAT